LIDQANLLSYHWTGHVRGGSRIFERGLSQQGLFSHQKNSMVTMYISVQSTLVCQPGGGGGLGACPRKILKIKLSKMNLRVFSATFQGNKEFLSV